MSGISAITQENGGGDAIAVTVVKTATGTTVVKAAGGTYAGGVRADKAQPYYQAYADDQFFYQPIAIQGTIHPTLSRSLTEEYYKYLPPLTRGHVVPNGYPLHQTGFDLLPRNFYPQIWPLDFRQDESQVCQFTYPNVKGTPWSETFSKAYPQLTKLPTGTKSPTLAALLAAKGTSVVQKDSTGKACGWYHPKYGFFSFAPHKLFDWALRTKRIHADPTAGYWQSTYSAWLQPSGFESVRDFVEVIVIVLCVAYGAAALGANGSAAAGGSSAAAGGTTASSTGLEATTLDIPAAPAIEAAPTLEATAITTGPALETLGAADIGTLIGGAGSLLSDVASGTAAVGSVTKALQTVGGLVGALLPKGAAPKPTASTSKTPAATTTTTASTGFDWRWAAAGGAALLALIALN